MHNNVRKIAMIGMLLAIQVVLGRFVSITLPVVKLSFMFLPRALTAMFFGPLWGAAAAVMGDFLVTVMGPYAYVPPMATTALLEGIVYALFLYRKSLTTGRVVACVLNGKTERDVTVHLRGGDLFIVWDKETGEVEMTGPAQFVFDGTVEI